MASQSDNETSARQTPVRGSTGLIAALTSALTFGTSGSFGHGLLAQGWTPGAVVAGRLALAGFVLLLPAVRALDGRWWIVRDHAGTILAYGVAGVAGCQLFFFSGVERLGVSMALLLEYTSPLLIVLGTWLVTRRTPGLLTMVGGVVALGGVALVIDLFGHLQVDALGLAFGFGAAGCSAAYFVISAKRHDDLPPLVLATGGLLTGALLLGLAGVSGVLSFTASTRPVTLLGTSLPWWVPLLGVSLIAAALAYVTGIVGTRALGATVASFVGLSEVLFAVLWAWILIGQRPLPHHVVGGAVILAGIVAIKLDDLGVGRRSPGQKTGRPPVTPMTAADT